MENRRKRVGIMGGTFDPVHIGHLLIAEQSYHQYHLDQVIFMPAGQPPHKQEQHISGAEHRLAMLKLAIADSAYFSVSDDELNKHGLSYTCETLHDLTNRHPYTDYFFIMGADSILQIESWRSPEEIFALCHILAAVRDDTNVAALEAQAQYLRDKYNAAISLLGAPQMHISSRELRQRIKDGTSIRYMVPEKVKNYIDFHHLYR